MTVKNGQYGIFFLTLHNGKKNMSNNGQKRLKMVKTGRKQSKMVKNGQNCQKSF